MKARNAKIIRASAVNIAGNVVLAAFKMAVGLISNSIAITVDAANNLSDALSSVVAIGGTMLARRGANDRHPFGYGRMEYIAAIAIAAIIIVAGISALVESVQAILEPPELDYRPVMLVIVGVACAAKIVLGLYLRRVGHEVESVALIGSGIEAVMDAVVSAATLAAAVIYLLFGVSVEAWLGAVIAFLVGKAGADLLFATVSKILGERVGEEVASRVEAAACEVEGVKLVSGLVLQDHGPGRLHGSLHITVDGSLSVAEYDEIARKVQQRVSEACGVKLVSVGAYPASGEHPDEREARATIGRIVWPHDDVVELRGLFTDAATKFARFDAVASFDRRDHDALRDELVAECEAALPGWKVEARVLADI